MNWDRVKYTVKWAAKDPFIQGAAVGIGIHCALLIAYQKLVPTPNMSLHLQKEILEKLVQGEALSFQSNIGELVLAKVTGS